MFASATPSERLDSLRETYFAALAGHHKAVCEFADADLAVAQPLEGGDAGQLDYELSTACFRLKESVASLAGAERAYRQAGGVAGAERAYRQAGGEPWGK
jgi:hypothetical protein